MASAFLFDLVRFGSTVTQTIPVSVDPYMNTPGLLHSATTVDGQMRMMTSVRTSFRDESRRKMANINTINRPGTIVKI